MSKSLRAKTLNGGKNTPEGEGAGYDIKQSATGSINKSPKKAPTTMKLKEAQSIYRQSAKTSKPSLMQRLTGGGGARPLSKMMEDKAREGGARPLSMIVEDAIQQDLNMEQGDHPQLNQVSAPLYGGEKGSEQDPFSSKYSPSVWDRLSLDLRIERDFKDEIAFEREEQGSMATTMRGGRGTSTHQLRSASNVQISPGATKWVSVREVPDTGKEVLFPQMTHGLAQKGLSALQFTTSLAKNVIGGDPEESAVCIVNKSPILFQIRRGQRLGTLLPLCRLPLN